MTRKIDLTQSSLWKSFPLRTMMIIAMLCFSSSMFAQTVTVLSDGTNVTSSSAFTQEQLDDYLNQLNQIDQSTPEGQAEYAALLEKLNNQIIGSYSTMTPEEQAAFITWLGDNPDSPLMDSSSPSAQKFLIALQNNETTVTQSGNNFTVNIPAPVYPEPTKSPYNDTFPLDPVK